MLTPNFNYPAIYVLNMLLKYIQWFMNVLIYNRSSSTFGSSKLNEKQTEVL